MALLIAPAGVEPLLGVRRVALAPDRPFPTAPLDSVCGVKRYVSARWLLGMSVTSPTPDARGQTGART